ncbi:MAG: autotransporter domain-containing protein, partial [Cyanobacteriota bacterium]
MQKQVLAIAKRCCIGAFFCLSALFELKASAQNFEDIYIFGDSLVDAGNLFVPTGGLFPPSPPYFNGRFTNGLVWVEVLATELEINANRVNNFAVGGSTSGTLNVNSLLLGSPLPALQTQINTFTTAPGSADPNALYVVWAGANDYLGGGSTDTTAVVNNLNSAVTTLTAEGAKNIIVVNLPDLGSTPSALANQTSAPLTALTNSHNNQLRTALQTQAQNSEVNIIPLDANALFNEVIAEPARFGLTNVTDACLNVGCSNPDEFLFWDAIHPTAKGHRLIAEYATAVLTAPQAVAPQADIALNIARRQVQNIDARLLALRSVRENPSENRVGVFINGDLNFGEKDASDSQTGFDFTTTGVTAGVDYRVTGNLALGVALGYVTNDTELNNDLGEIESKGYAVSVYSNFVQNNFYTDAVVSYGENDFDIKRQIAFDNRTATADTDGNQLSVDVNSGYNIKSGNASFGPTVGIRYDRVNIDGYTEEGADSLNMKVEDQKAESVVLSVGAQASVAFNTGIGTVIPNVR